MHLAKTPAIIIFTIILSNICIAQTNALWEIPKDIQSKTISSTTIGQVQIQQINYVSSYYQNKPVKIFGYFCFPQNLKKSGMPGIILVHGGAGHADKNSVIHWAKKGYATLSIDLPGKGERREISRSTGPNMDVPILFKVTPDISENYLYHAVRAARGSISFLEDQKFVNRGIAMVGLSWGGVITLIVNGIDDRLSAAVPVFGSGFLSDGSTWQEWFDSKISEKDLETYINNFDAQQYLKTQHAPLLYMTGTNDHCFYLPNFIRSYLSMEVECTLSIFPNVRHKVYKNMQNTISKWLAYKLKGEKPLSTILLEDTYQSNDFVWFKINVTAESSQNIVKLVYSTSGVDKWTSKKWQETKATISKDGYYWAKLAPKIIKPEIVFYALAKDNKGAQTSTPIYSLFRISTDDGRIFLIKSTPIDKIFEHSISYTDWEHIFGAKPPSDKKTIPLTSIWTIGGSIKKTKNAYYLKLAKK